jgi:hypothetical protein
VEAARKDEVLSSIFAVASTKLADGQFNRGGAARMLIKHLAGFGLIPKLSSCDKPGSCPPATTVAMKQGGCMLRALKTTRTFSGIFTDLEGAVEYVKEVGAAMFTMSTSVSGNRSHPTAPAARMQFKDIADVRPTGGKTYLTKPQLDAFGKLLTTSAIGLKGALGEGAVLKWGGGEAALLKKHAATTATVDALCVVRVLLGRDAGGHGANKQPPGLSFGMDVLAWLFFLVQEHCGLADCHTQAEVLGLLLPALLEHHLKTGCIEW